MAGEWKVMRKKGEYMYFLPVLTLALYLTAMPGHGDSTRGHALKFNRSHFLDLTDPCSRTGSYETILNRTHPAALLKLDIRYKTLVTYQSFDCIIKVKTEFHNKSREFYNENEDVAVMMFDINHGYRRKEDAIKLELVHIAKLDQNGTRFFYQKKKFQLPQYVPYSLPGYVLYGFEEIAQWHAESNSSISVNMKRWKSSGSIYFVFAQYRIVSPYHCDTGIEVDCNDNSAVFAHCFPSALLPLFLDGLPFCEFHPLHALGSNRTTCGAPDLGGSSPSLLLLVLAALQVLLPLCVLR